MKANTNTSRHKRVLIVDGHQEVLISLEKLLEDAGFNTTTSWTAADAARFLRSTQYDVVLVNEYLPDCYCEALLRARKRNDEACWIVMQGTAPEMSDRDRFIRLGADAVVCKHQTQTILETVCRMTSWPAGSAA